MPRFPPDEGLQTAETWLRRQGLPFFVTPRRRSSLLLSRTAPFVVAVFYIDVARWLGANLPVTVEDDGSAAAVVAVVAVWVLLPLGTLLMTANVLRQLPAQQTRVGAVLLAGFLVLEPALETSWLDATLVDAALVTAALLVTWLGLGAIVGWATRTTLQRVRAIGLVATRAVPLLMLVVVFALFSRSLWEITGTLSADRLVAVIMFFIGLDLLVIVPLTRSEMALDAREPDDGFGPPLGRLELANVELVLILAQCFQVAIFFTLVAAFLVALGTIVFSNGVLADWSGTAPAPFMVAGAALPFDVALVKTALFLACVSSLNFLVSASNQSAYKSAFYDPLFSNAKAALAVRSAYLAEAENAR